MQLPPELDSLIKEYLEILQNDEDSMLNPFYRVQLYNRILATPTLADTKLIQWLQIITAEHVLPITNGLLEDCFNPEELLDIAKRRLLRRVSEEEIVTRQQELHNDFSELRLEGEPPRVMRAYNALFAADAALNWSLEFLPLPKFEKSDNAEDWMDPDADAANWACAAYAGTIWDSEDFYNSVTGLEFWEWWLTEAIPHAWEMTHTNNKSG